MGCVKVFAVFITQFSSCVPAHRVALPMIPSGKRLFGGESLTLQEINIPSSSPCPWCVGTNWGYRVSSRMSDKRPALCAGAAFLEALPPGFQEVSGFGCSRGVGRPGELGGTGTVTPVSTPGLTLT